MAKSTDQKSTSSLKATVHKIWHGFGRMALFIGIAILTGVITAVFIFFDSSKSLIVPDVKGLSKADATNKLVKLGFKKITYDQTQYAGKSNIALRTDPDSGSLAKNLGTIKIFISEFQGIDIPNLKGKSENDALTQLREDFKLTDKNIKLKRVYSSKKVGNVINTTTKKNFNPHDDVLTLEISDGRDVFAIGDWVNKPFSDSRDSLIAEGVTAEHITITYENSTTIAAGFIISQKPDQHTEYHVKEPSDLRFVVSSGSVVKTGEMPSLTGLSYNDAVAKLTALGMASDHITYSGVKTSNVSDQSIATGTTVFFPDSYITLVMAAPQSYQRAIDQIDPKTLVGTSATSAITTLRNLGITCKIDFTSTTSVAAGSIISAVANGDTLELNVATTPSSDVPNASDTTSSSTSASSASRPSSSRN
ncbi:PASTA domain-containing protein [Lactococcus insecticola]|uniref:PASTA domain-containing protein n=1 Tax=Pseudolactococcus insecticola TaxID=2709158 RepID=A0A6A0B569_9LACT|nr:PASTA domain-containing protein [Lactococcus insecticola]GFH39628.1 hypothetical protein Hs20B_00260 [Lactococcus insecticola]